MCMLISPATLSKTLVLNITNKFSTEVINSAYIFLPMNKSHLLTLKCNPTSIITHLTCRFTATAQGNVNKV